MVTPWGSLAREKGSWGQECGNLLGRGSRALCFSCPLFWHLLETRLLQRIFPWPLEKLGERGRAEKGRKVSGRNMAVGVDRADQLGAAGP